MTYREKPKFIMKRNMQKSAQTGIYFDSLVTEHVISKICVELTGRHDYEAQFVENDYEVLKKWWFYILRASDLVQYNVYQAYDQVLYIDKKTFEQGK